MLVFANISTAATAMKDVKWNGKSAVICHFIVAYSEHCAMFCSTATNNNKETAMSLHPDNFNDRVLDGPSRAYLSTEEGVVAALTAQDKAFAEAFAKHAAGDELTDALQAIDAKTGDFLGFYTEYSSSDSLYKNELIDLADYRKDFPNIARAYPVM